LFGKDGEREDEKRVGQQRGGGKKEKGKGAALAGYAIAVTTF